MRSATQQWTASISNVNNCCAHTKHRSVHMHKYASALYKHRSGNHVYINRRAVSAVAAAAALLFQ